jgi:hypothetical protein
MTLSAAGAATGGAAKAGICVASVGTDACAAPPINNIKPATRKKYIEHLSRMTRQRSKSFLLFFSKKKAFFFLKKRSKKL